MRKSRGIASVLLALAGAGMLVAGPIMIAEGVQGQSEVRSQLTDQKITFPDKGSSSLPKGFESYAGTQVKTGPEAKKFADMVEIHVKKATGGLTYSEVSEKYLASGGKDATLGAQRQTAFMGESLRSSLMSAYEAWQLTWLVIGLGALLTGLAVVFGVTAWTLRPARVTVPASPEGLAHQGERVATS